MESSTKKKLVRNIGVVVSISLFLYSFSMQAQEIENEQDGEVEDAEVLITKDRQLTLPKVEKIFEKTRIGYDRVTHEIRPNVFKSYSYELQKPIANILAATPIYEEANELYRNYVRVGFGNFSSPLINAGLHLPTEDDKVLGINLDHLSYGKGAKDGKNSASSLSDAGIHGKLIGKKAVLSSALNFKRQTEYFYGYDESLEVNRDTIKQQFNFFQVSADIEDANNKDEWNYDFSLGFRNVSDNFSASESAFQIASKLNYTEKISLLIDVHTSRYSDASELNRNYVRMNPYYSFQVNDVLLDMGFSYSVQNDTASILNESKVFPYLSAKYDLSDDFEVFAKIDGGFEFNTYWDIVNNNPYVKTDLPVQNAEVKYDVGIGLKGSPIDKLGLELTINNRSVENKGFFVNAVADTAKFNLIYPSNSTKITRINGKANIILNQSHELGLDLNYFDYSNSIGTLPHVPNFSVELNGDHEITEELRLKWTFYSLNGITAFESGSGDEKSLSIQNLNISTLYKINNKFSIFFNFDNMLNQNYQRYLNYEQRGLQFKAGIFCKF